MCALCGLLGIGHWSDGVAAAEDSQADPPADPLRPAARRRERQRRVQGLNRVLGFYGLGASDWQGSAYLLSTRTGRTEIAADPAALWALAEEMAGRKLDPLDPALLAHLAPRPDEG